MPEIDEPYTGHFGPAHGGAAGGQRIAAWLDVHLLGHERDITPLANGQEAWLERVCAAADGELQGLDIAPVPSGWHAVLRRAGLPFARGGPLRWGPDVVAATMLQVPEIADGRLRLPAPERLAACSGVELRPVRRFVAERFGVRLQAAPAIAVYLWRNQGVLVSLRDEPLGGFLHGPEAGSRQNLAWAPGQALWVRW